ncbi:SDR family NAD(P)-dependent oxidoreductase [Solimonas marina]|uniref:SDR family NAD(P)-dependent oxidoreductase n=1 Tax=Solimonas marina TaxID=2714601 RepID=A0A970B6N5_9GAMM|nr:SDR family NAD(P)-dependent oxidoreductase [Solimonas marina]NKF23003.1 SDR family NAD(P)-dependent oxidoreductase [Solimonas marina]
MIRCTHTVISGAGSGLGLGLALRLLRRGAHVSVLDQRVGDAARLALDAAGGSWSFHQIDIRDEHAVKAAVQAAVDAHGAPDLAINSAGIVLNRTLGETSGEAFRRVIDVNLNGSFHFAAAVLPTMKRDARLALIASLAGLTSNYAYSAYGASKFGVVGLATTLRYEYESRGIHISCICPPEVKTPMVAEERRDGDPISLSIKNVAGSLDADDACDRIVVGLDAGRWLIVPGINAKMSAMIGRHLPGVFNAFMQFMVKRGRRRAGEALS